MTGIVRCGVNNIYTVDANGREIECRIKGKVFKEDERSHNPLAVGDVVTVEPDGYSALRGNIVGREKRRNALVRWNKNTKSIQTLACNVDHLAIVSSFAEPPFRPRFIDRLLVAARAGGVEPFVLVNKRDLGADEEIRARLQNYRDCGYTVLEMSVQTGEGLGELAAYIANKVTVFAGQSGTGKSSILNALAPALALRVGTISAKHDRGAHTTNCAVMLSVPGRFQLIDTPGIRELDVADVPCGQLKFYFPEFAQYLPRCQFPSCLHRDEPACAVKAAVEHGEILFDRYDSYLRLLVDLEAREEAAYD
jgi:ribosome biogenesis GTPase